MRPSRGVAQTGTPHSQTHTHSLLEAQGTLLYSPKSRRPRRCDSFLLGIRKVLTELTVSCRDRAPPERTPTPRCWCEAVRRDKENGGGGGGGGGYGCGGRTVNEGHPAAWHTARSPTHSTPPVGNPRPHLHPRVTSGSRRPRLLTHEMPQLHALC